MAKYRTEKPTPALERRFYSITDAATYLGVSEQFLYNGTCRRAKKPLPIPFRRLGGKILFDLRDLEKI
jgi:hypothetical protein